MADATLSFEFELRALVYVYLERRSSKRAGPSYHYGLEGMDDGKFASRGRASNKNWTVGTEKITSSAVSVCIDKIGQIVL
ncbi:uncharacterized protein I206_107881 [Kwoniella pini CBS 10737]|uniref:Uncharacterized protein n=1 Tax=Kwoniella pini CBS 10737 TaxID=1296096 RepID=A0A1B9HYK4_9TREE|nr:uncharacterized protein I206_06214 [Kwoniella pini CBS 10737]OCF48346.1 hypothetical protein I206_06214 [Kwoniella pini CBS 10737]